MSRRFEDDKDDRANAQARMSGRVRRVGNYIIERRLGAGGQADVFLARDVVLRRLVALKVLHKTSGSNANIRGLDEARLIATLDHTNIVRVHHVELSEGVWYMAMEYVDGGNMELRVHRTGPVEPVRALKSIQVIADALQHAHKIGVIHRDVKPQNLLETRAGILKLADFGLAGLRQDSLDNTAKAVRLVGTPQYTAPEVWRGEAATARSDIYSLGATLYFMIVGQPPFGGKTVRDLRSAHLTQPLPIPPDMAQPLASVLQRSMAKNPNERPVSAKAFFEDMNDVIAALTGDRRRSRRVVTEVVKLPDYGPATRSAADTAVLRVPTLAATRDKLEQLLLGVPPLLVFHGSQLASLGRIVRGIVDVGTRRFYTAARVVVSSQSPAALANRIIEQLHMASGPMPAWHDRVVSELQPEAGTGSTLPSILELELRRPLTTAETTDLIELGRRAEGKNVIFLVMCGREQVAPLIQEIEASSYSFLLRHLALPDMSGREYAEFIRTWTGIAAGERVRWTDDAIRLARHYEATKKKSIDQLMHNSIIVANHVGRKLLTTWCVMAADAHPNYIHSNTDILPLWHQWPPSWPDEQLLGTLFRLRGLDTERS
jgi:serine/threonine protein kinase